MFAVPMVHVKSSLPDYVTGRLHAGFRSAVEEHLRECPSCRQDYETIQEALRVLQGDLQESPSSFYFSSFLPRVRERLGRRVKLTWLESPLFVRLVAPLAAAALMVILAVELPLLRSQTGVVGGGELFRMVGFLSSDELSQVLMEHGNGQLFVDPDQEVTVPQALIERMLSEELLAGSGTSDPPLAPFMSAGTVSSESLNLLSDPQVELLLQRLEERSIL